MRRGREVRRRWSRVGATWLKLFVWAAVIGGALLPVLAVVMVSFQGLAAWPGLWNEQADLSAWVYVLMANDQTWTSLFASMWLALLVTAINLMLAIPAADALARYSFPGRAWIAGLLYAPIVIPLFVSVMGLQMQFIRWGLSDSWLGVLLIHIPVTFPYMLRALTVSYATLDFAWEEQGRMLGAGRLRRWRDIVWPHLASAVYTGAAISLLVSLSQYLLTLIIGGGNLLTFPLVFFPFAAGSEPAVGAVFALLFAVSSGWILWLIRFLVEPTQFRKAREE